MTPPARSMILLGHTESVNAVAVSPSGEQLLSGSDDWTMRVWDPVSGILRSTIDMPCRVTGLAFNPSGDVVAVGGPFGIHFFDATSSSRRSLDRDRHLRGGRVGALTFSLDGVQFACSADHLVLVWDIRLGALTHVLEHDYEVIALAISPDGRLIASSSYDETVQIWDAHSGQALHLFEGHGGYIRALCFCPQGLRIASASDDGTVQIWDVSTGKVQQVFRNTARYTAVAFRATGRYLLSGSSDAQVQLHDIRTGQRKTYFGHSGIITTVGFFHQDKFAVSGGLDGSVRIWKLSDDQLCSFVQPSADIIDASKVMSGPILCQAIQFVV